MADKIADELIQNCITATREERTFRPFGKPC